MPYPKTVHTLPMLLGRLVRVRTSSFQLLSVAFFIQSRYKLEVPGCKISYTPGATLWLVRGDHGVYMIAALGCGCTIDAR